MTENSTHARSHASPYHTTEVHVRWSDFDRFGHLNNAAYIELAQEARAKFGVEEFLGRGQEIPAVFIRRLSANYMHPILPDTTSVIVETRVTHVGTTSFTTSQAIYDRHGTISCAVECVQIAVDLGSASPREITAHEMKVLNSSSGEPHAEQANSAPDTSATDDPTSKK